MRRPIHLHPVSLLLGAVFCFVSLMSMGQMQVAQPSLHPSSPWLVVSHPRDWVVIKEGIPYTVPTGKILVLSALGGENGAPDLANLFIDGTREVTGLIRVYGSGPSSSPWPGGNNLSVRELPVGLSATGGQTVEVTGGNSNVDTRAWGYLVNA